ncbi:MAG: hypothetical protein ABI833_01400 [Acidobacteriota bacterium]
MTAKLSLLVFVVCHSAVGQIDATALRAKYGEPLARETFQVRPNIEAIVSYGHARQVCRIELPPGNYKNVSGEVPLRLASRQQVDEVADELAPPSVRGKELTHSVAGSGRTFMAMAEYEHLTVDEPQDPDHPGRRTAVWIRFKRPDCH